MPDSHRRYAFLVQPAANRVYAEAAPALTRSELGVFADRVLTGPVGDIEEVRIAGVPYVCFTAPELTERELGYLGNLSSLHALFERVGDGDDELLRPLPVTRWDRYDDDLLTIQKYSGKTNEHFTKLLLNVTALSSRWAGELPTRRMRVLDPLCGRGTTLNQALTYGWDATGFDHDERDFEAYSTFLRTWCKRKRLKHTAEAGRVRRDRVVLGRELTLTVAPTKEDHRAGATQTLRVVCADTLQARSLHKAGSFELVVADLPYGVQHGSRSGSGPGSLARSPLELLRRALPGWVELLRSGGALGLSWNTHVAGRDELAGLLADAGLEVVDEPAAGGFEHRVDASIQRDLVVARKP